MRRLILFGMVAVMALPGGLRADEEEKLAAAVAEKVKVQWDLVELEVLKREYEEARLARLRRTIEIENLRAEMKVYRDRSLRQREMQERLDALTEGLPLLDALVATARDRLDKALRAAAETSAKAPPADR